jgi:hypothetical protein
VNKILGRMGRGEGAIIGGDGRDVANKGPFVYASSARRMF